MMRICVIWSLFVGKKAEREYYKIPMRYYCQDRRLKTLLICHGNSSDVGQVDVEKWGSLFCCNICVFDYCGYGMHSCKYGSEEEAKNDVVAVYEHLVFEKKVHPHDIIIFGRSLGTGLACYLGYYINRHYCVKAQKMILVTPLLTTGKTMLNLWYPGDIFKNYEWAPYVSCYVLIIHGVADSLVPYWCGVELASYFPRIYNFVSLKYCNHGYLYIEEYYKSIKEFIEVTLPIC